MQTLVWLFFLRHQPNRRGEMLHTHQYMWTGLNVAVYRNNGISQEWQVTLKAPETQCWNDFHQHRGSHANKCIQRYLAPPLRAILCSSYCYHIPLLYYCLPASQKRGSFLMAHEYSFLFSIFTHWRGWATCSMIQMLCAWVPHALARWVFWSVVILGPWVFVGTEKDAELWADLPRIYYTATSV